MLAFERALNPMLWIAVGQRGHGYVADSPIGIAEPLDQRVDGIVGFHSGEGFRRAPSHEGVRISQKFQERRILGFAAANSD